MQYDREFFDRGLNRKHTGCEKWDAEFMGEDTLPLWVADMDFACAEAIGKAMAERAMHPCFGYNTDEAAYADAFCRFMQRRHQLAITEREMLRLPCVVTGLKTCIQAYTKKGEKVAIFSPCYGPFAMSVRDNERELVSVPLLQEETGRFLMNLEGMEKALKEGARLILLCNPHNPASRAWEREELEGLAALAKRYRVPVISDEIHADFVFAPGKFHSMLHVTKEQVVALFAASKTFNIAGLQQAQLVTFDEEMKQKAQAVLSRNGVACGNTMALHGTMAAYNEGDAWLDGLMDYLDENRKALAAYVAEYLPKAKLTPITATYLAWLDLKAYGKTCEEMKQAFLARGVALTDGTFFGPEGEGCMRLNFGCPRAQMLEGIKRMAMALEEEKHDA